MKIKYFKKWTRQDVRDHPKLLFIFGDNDIQKGRGGQAIIRGLPNTMGIPTKKLPYTYNEAYYNDNELDVNQQRIDAAIDNILSNLSKYQGVSLPTDGFGTGLANLPVRAPKTFAYLESAVAEMIEKIKAFSNVSLEKKYVCDGDNCVLVTDDVEENTISEKVNGKNLNPENDQKELIDFNSFLPKEKDQWTVYGTKTCPYCHKACDLLKEQKINFRYVSLDEHKKEIVAKLRPLIGPDHKTIPIIFYQNEFIGGFSQLQERLN